MATSSPCVRRSYPRPRTASSRWTRLRPAPAPSSSHALQQGSRDSSRWCCASPRQVVRCAKDVLIVRHRLGFVVANAGVDQSNIESAGSRVLLLPEDPDRSAAGIRDAIAEQLGVRIGVLITDSFGRAWRLGVCGTCIGCAGLVPLADARGRPDRFGRPLRVTQIAVADAIAAAAALAMGEADEGRPIVVVSGVAARVPGGRRACDASGPARRGRPVSVAGSSPCPASLPCAAASAERSSLTASRTCCRRTISPSS